ncbi:MAG: DNA-protecting protein DprA [Helicobacteraceae bacterium]|jgi:DNA processing protein|nr:DNA-protecting protein DprA [Helicobacteraceae bacterium]
MAERLAQIPAALSAIYNPPAALYYEGDPSLLKRPLVAIVGSRIASNYAKTWTKKIASALSKAGAIVVSGGASGIDGAAHEAAFPNTIAILASSIDMDDRKHIAQIKQNALVLSEYDQGVTPRNWSFVHRNRLITGIAAAVCVMQAEPKSGSEASCNIALKQSKRLFALPHRLGESEATNRLLASAKASAIWSEETLLNALGLRAAPALSDPLLRFAADRPSYDDALERFGALIYEYELAGKIVVKDGRIELADAGY